MNKETLQSLQPRKIIFDLKEWNRRRLYDGKHQDGVKPPVDAVSLHAKTEYVFPEDIPSHSWARRVEDRLAEKALTNFSIQIDEPTTEIPPLYSPDERFRLSSFTVRFTPDASQPNAEKERSKEEIREELLALTKKLVEHKTVTGNTEELEKAFEDILLYTQTISQKRGKPYFVRLFHTEVNNGNKPIPSLVIAASEEALTRPTTIHLGHLDVVPGADEQFALQVETDGTIKGRGVVDMKGAIAAQLALLRDFEGEAIVLTGDEEERDYSAHAVANIVQPQTGIINLDGAYSDKLNTGAKGCERIIIKAEGNNVGGHDAYNREGYTTKDALALLHTLIELRFSSDGRRRLRKTSWNERTTINAGEYTNNSEKFVANAVPVLSEEIYSLRYPDEKSLQKVYRFIDRAIRIINTYGKYPKLSRRTLLHLTPSQFNWNNPFVKKWEEITDAITGVALGKEVAGGRSDGDHFLTHNPHIPVVSVRFPGEGYHHDNEQTTVTDLESTYRILREHLLWTQNQEIQTVDIATRGQHLIRRTLPAQYTNLGWIK